MATIITSYAQLATVMSTVNGSSFVGIDTQVNVTLTGGKKNEHQGRVKKVTQNSSVMVFQNKNSNGYENMVNRRLEAEGKDASDFTLGERAWGKRVPNTPFIEHTDKFGNEKKYLEVIFLKGGESSFTLDDIPTDASEIVGLPVSKNGEQGGLENKVVIRTYDIASIRRLRINKEEYIVQIG